VSFEEYVSRQGAALLRLAFVLTSDAHLAEDLTQSALVDAYRHWRKVVAAANPDRYVRRILVNRYLSSRRVKSVAEFPLDPTDVDVDVAQPTDASDAVVSADHVRWLLRDLPPRAKTVLVLRYYADLDDAAIADAMGTTESTVRATASRALRALRDEQRSTAAREG